MLWTAPGFAYRVTISATVLDEIRFEVAEAYYSAPRGGVEVGGVFFGAVLGDSLHIKTYRPAKCQYLYGPSFRLSPEDKLNLSGVRALPESDPELAGLAAIGWYHSHHRSEIFLSADNLQLYEEFFPERWQVAMVLRPAHLQPTRAGFFFRDQWGCIKSDAPVQEFIMDPPGYGLTLVDPEAENAIAQKLASSAPPAANGSAATSRKEGPGPAVPKTARETGPSPKPATKSPLGPETPPPVFEVRERPRDTVRIQPVETAKAESLWKTNWDNLRVRPQPPKRNSDRRSARRESGEGLTAFYWEGGRPHGHRVRDISRWGAYIETDFSWPRGTQMILTLQIGSNGAPNSIAMPVEIVRTSPEGMGLRFLLSDLSGMRELLQFLRRWNPNSAHLPPGVPER